MRRGLLAFFFFAAAASPLFAATVNFSSSSARPAAVVLEKPSGIFPEREKLRFDVNWMGAHIGYGEIEVRGRETVNGREAWHVVAVARTNEVLSALYPVRDEAHSWIDVETRHSLKFRKILSEGRYRADEEVEFFPDRKKGHYRSYKNGTEKDFDVPGPVHDIVSAFYWFRLQDVPPGRSAKAVVNSEEQNWDLEVSAIGLEAKEIRGMGRVGTLCVEPKSRLKGALYSRGRVWVYFTADGMRKPVWFLFRTPFGPVQGVLSVSGSVVS